MKHGTADGAVPRTHGSAARAIGVICLGLFFLALNDATAKWLTGHYHPVQLLFLRYLIALPAVVAIAAALHGRRGLATRRPGLHLLRGFLLVTGGLTFFLSLARLPLAQATSLAFAAPIFITALSVPLLGDRVGWRRWTACGLGFAGVLMIVRPGAAGFDVAALLPVGTAVSYALVMISARWIDEQESVWTMMVHVTLFPLVFTALAVPFVWEPLAVRHLPQILVLAVFGTLGMTLISQAFRMAPAPVVAPFEYTSLVWASLFGWIVWRETPDAWTCLGALVIAGSGLYIFHREGRHARG